VSKKGSTKKLLMAVTNDLVTDQRVHKVALTLMKMGFEITLAGRDYPSGKTALDRPYATKRFHLWANKGPLFYAFYNIRLFTFLLFSRFNVVVSNDLDTLAACYFASKLKRMKLVYDSHEYFTEVPELVSRPRTKKIWEAIERRIVPKLQHCYTVCESIAQIYTKKYGTTFRVVRNLPFLSQGEPEITNTTLLPTDKPVVIYQGAVNLGRGIEEAILAMHHIEDVYLVIIGSGDLLEDCKALAIREKLTGRVFFTGRMPFNEVKKYTQIATIGLSVEKEMGLNYKYALPNKLFDYIQSGIPALTSSLPEMKRVMETYKVGVMINETSPENISTALREMLENKTRYKQMKENCALAKPDLCWEKEEEVLRKIYQAVL
jgi:glycosyltransferase involved in cell wall biosynthesis